MNTDLVDDPCSSVFIRGSFDTLFGTMAQSNKFLVNAELGLNLRSEPAVANRTRIAVLPFRHQVTKIADENAAWAKVNTELQGTRVTGFVAKRFLSPAGDIASPPAARRIREVHLTTSGPVRRNMTSGRAFPLDEPGQPARDLSAGAAAKATALGKILDWLDVERSARYRRTPNTTYCNIYAYDYCFLGGAYLPRVWWTSAALLKLYAGETVRPVYGATVHELNANALFNWFRDFGTEFGWKRLFDLDQLQTAANGGEVAVITGQNRVPNRSGHINVVVPETDTHKAARSGGSVTRALQSQAGATNFKYRTSAWYTGAQFRDFAFYIHP
jgi:hypothetical protein